MPPTDLTRPLVGRAAELDRLVRALAGAARQVPATVLVAGEAAAAAHRLGLDQPTGTE
jgi:hypothetical protein